MRAVIQRVSKGSVKVNGEIVGKIDKGILALIGISDSDNDETIQYIIQKILDLRIFEDDNDKMNLSLKDIKGGLLVVPNFTLYGDCRKGRRPSYASGASVENARLIFEKFMTQLKNSYDLVEQGVFQAEMQVELLNDGPVTLLIDSERNF
ncbi:D-tyrosyl-tRNA(Tyr) deacylase [Natranaerovirga pectinivora]|uniref:D-aminoacyl-tRNA deacylase n=1 Tax=Natranaerovirga pectinivora TaxID=682400 RepID=A0A4R3MQI4_9FIRM|nr:D-aminoacyl-tRNA deacylase [Natranaerovirga pectinivora]TCT16783.1 D-tyrosyl-tRNA(Tyr) deacylase [Natranaerovirga pectinivora]